MVADAVMLVPAGATPNTATWTLSVPSAGSYQVYARWTQHPNRATDAKYTVTHASGSTQVTVDMEQGGANWNLLGTFNFNSGPATVSLTDQANGYVIADAVMLVPPGAAANTATWTPNVAQAGTYEVHARWTQHANRATNATYTVTHAAGSSAVAVNQQQSGGAWNLLGTFSLSPGSAHKVSLSDQANGFVIADAIRLVPISIQVEPKLHFIHVDHLNTVRLIADDQQRTVWRNDNTEPFSDSPPDENPSGLGVFEFPLTLSQYYRDKETGMRYSMFRDCYDPATGRFCQSDPIGLGGGINTYAYAASSPLFYTDPTGELIWVPIVIGAALVAATQSTTFQNAAANAAQYWANQQQSASNPVAAGAFGFAGGLAALADPCTVNTTAMVLGAPLAASSISSGVTWYQGLGATQAAMRLASQSPQQVMNLYLQLMNNGRGASIQAINNYLLKYGGAAGAAQVQAVNGLVSQAIANPATNPVVRQALMSLQSLM